MYFSDWRRAQKDREMFNISRQYVAEGFSKDQFEHIIHLFLPFVKKEIKMKQIPKLHFINDSKFAKRIGAFGEIKNNRIAIDIQDRHIVDVLRTVAHELVHYHQHEMGIHGNGDAGSSTENQANEIAGIIVRKFAKNHSYLFSEPAIVKEMKMKKKRKKMIDIDSDHYPMELS